MHSTEDKAWWCKKGEALERKFVEKVVPLYGLDVTMNPDKEQDKYTHDLLFDGIPADLKFVQTPFFTAGKYGVNPDRAVTINLKDIERYKKLYPNIVILFYVKWRKQEKFSVKVNAIEGLWAYPLEDLIAITSESEIHSYKRRRGKSDGNAKASYVIELEDTFKKKTPD
jgi:hypothetical protein